MQISSRFSIALHILICMAVMGGERRITSSFLAGSINVNPVIIRNILSQLKSAGIIGIARGTKGAFLLKNTNDITLLDVYAAIGSLEKENLFNFHKNPNPQCPIGRNIHNLLDGRLMSAQKALEESLCNVSISEVVQDLDKF